MNTRQLAALLQFRFRTLLIWVAFVALAVTSLVNASAAWSLDLYCAAVAFLALAIPLACYRGGEQRAFWAGVALCGWVYLLVIGNLDDRPRIQWHNAVSRGPSANVPTSRLTYWVYVKSFGEPHPDEDPAAASAGADLIRTRWALSRDLLIDAPGSISGNSIAAGAAAARPRPLWWDFLNVGHALWTILLAYLGGLIVRGIYVLRPLVPE